MFDSLFENLCTWNDEQWQLHTENELVTAPTVDDWQQRHDDRFASYTEDDWKYELESQRLEVLRMQWFQLDAR
jgi:hypothetical protein